MPLPTLMQELFYTIKYFFLHIPVLQFVESMEPHEYLSASLHSRFAEADEFLPTFDYP